MIQPLLNLLAPDDCLECGQEGSVWCEWCRLDQEPLPSRCFKCQAMTANFDTCKKCRRQTAVKRVYVASEYKDVPKELVQALKYDCKRHAARPIARTLAELTPYYSPDVLVVAVPTAPLHVRQRGFDHTYRIAKEFASLKSLEYMPVLAKLNNLRQVGASKKVRLSQVNGSYRVKRNKNVAGKHAVLVDDVVTTGATLAECIKVLKGVGAKSVEAVVFAYSK